MMYRNVAADELDWIKSVNAIELVFHNNERVRQLFTRFIDCLTDPAKFQEELHVDVYYEMLYLMAQDCGYTQITKVDLMKNIYAPKSLVIHYPNRYFDPAARVTTPELAALLEEVSQYGVA